ncbi:hypothetical protein GCM10018775_16630 [Streptomyces umbrinus]|nr:hypothetical protein GCM10018775_16630 [Streptomyces umbrinus]
MGQGRQGRLTATGMATVSDSVVTGVTGWRPVTGPRLERVSFEGWRYGKMGCICPLPISSVRTVSLG